MCKKIYSAFVLFFLVKMSVGLLGRDTFRSLVPFRECFIKKFPSLCLKERALDTLNATIMSDKPLVFMNMLEVARNPEYKFKNLEDYLPAEVSARSSKLSDLLYDKIEEYFKSRVFKINMAPAFEEGRGKKDKGKGAGLFMLASLGAMAWMMAQLFMGKIAVLAGGALIVAKVALFLAAIVGLKKVAGNGGGGETTSHIVYATDAHGHGGGGWHRSLNADAQNLAYRAHINDPSSGY